MQQGCAITKRAAYVKTDVRSPMLARASLTLQRHAGLQLKHRLNEPVRSPDSTYARYRSPPTTPPIIQIRAGDLNPFGRRPTDLIGLHFPKSAFPKPFYLRNFLASSSTEESLSNKLFIAFSTLSILDLDELGAVVACTPSPVTAVIPSGNTIIGFCCC